MDIRSLTLAVAVLSVASCKEPAKEAPAPAASASAPVTASATAQASAPAAGVAPSASASAAKHSETCEVEIFGKVIFPPKLPKGKKFKVYVAQDDCLSDKAQILGHADVGMDGGIVIEVFPKWGTDVTICAGSDEGGEGKPTTIYGKAKGTFHAEEEGEVTFADVKIEVEQGKPPHVFPPDAQDVKPSKMPSGSPSGSPSAKQ